MPDLTTHTTFTCHSNIQWGPVDVESSKGDKTYQVSFGRLFGRRATTMYGYTCTCKGFQMRSKCSHIMQVASQRCAWNAELEITFEPAKDANGDYCCPECSGSVNALSVGV
jgi:hypothetical protein